METEHDLKTTVGVFGYFAEHTGILKPIEQEFDRILQENEDLKTRLVLAEQALLDLYTGGA